MKAFMVYEPGKYGIVDAKLPEISDDEILVKVGAASICHSDVDIIDGKRKFLISYPVITGHEFAGTVAQVGKSAIGFKEGDTIASECMIWCGACRQCNLGHRAQCENFSELGTMRDGAFAEYVAVPYRLAHKFSGIPMNEAATIECAGDGYNAVESSGIMPGDVVVIIGPGPIGLYSLQFAKLKFPSQIIVVGTRDARLEFARDLGATSVININKEDAFDRIMDLTCGKGADVIIQCATTDSAFDLAFKVAGRYPRIIIEGYGNTDKGINVDFGRFIEKSMCVKGMTGVDSDHFECVIRLMEAGLVNANKMITNVMKLENIIEGFNMLKAKNGNVVKVVLNP